MWLSDSLVKRPRSVAAIVLSLLRCVFGVFFIGQIDLKENS